MPLSLRIHIISGGGFPLARHSTTAPVEFEKSIRFNGSLVKIGPFKSASLLLIATTPINKNRTKKFNYFLSTFVFKFTVTVILLYKTLI